MQDGLHKPFCGRGFSASFSVDPGLVGPEARSDICKNPFGIYTGPAFNSALGFYKNQMHFSSP